MEKRRIKILISSVSPGGVKRHIKDIVTWIDRDRFEVVGAFPEKSLDRIYQTDEETNYHTIFTKAGHESHVVEIPTGLSPFRSVWAAWQLARLMRKIRPDVLHCHSSMAGAVGRLATVGYRPPVVIYTPHLIYFLRWAGLKRSIFLYLEKLLFPLCDRIVAVSRAEYDGIMDQLGPSDKIVRIYNAIPIEHRDIPGSSGMPASSNRHPAELDEELAKGLNVQKRTGIILSIARLDSQKDVGTLIRAAALLQEDHPDFVVLLAGGGKEQRQLMELARDLGVDGRIRFLGWRNDVQHLIDLCDIVVLSTRREGLPYALLEAMAMGKPVLGSDVEGVQECMEHVGWGLFPLGDAKELARKLACLLDSSSLCREMGEKARKSCLDNFAPEMMMTRLAELYTSATEATATEKHLPCKRKHESERIVENVEPATPLFGKEEGKPDGS